MGSDPDVQPEQAAESRLRVVSAALRAFAETTTDYERLLGVIARTLSDVVKDGCVVRLLSDGGWLSPVAVHLPFESYVEDAEAAARVRAHVAMPHNISEQAAARRVIETGEPHLVPVVDLDQLRAAATPEIVRAYETIGIHSLLLVALRVRGESLGLLALARFAPSSAPFSETDRDTAQELADHAALAISNARLLKAALRDLAQREEAEATLRRTEEQLRHAQKMEAVGGLAGGIAHDFNNLLSVILTYAELLGAKFAVGDPIQADIGEIKTAGLRAVELTRQLLAFSRQQVLETGVLNLNDSVLRIENILGRLLGADIELTTLLAIGLWNVRADAGQIVQIVMNLAVNARDAMQGGGKLTIETANVELDEEYASAHYGVSAGAYVLLAMTDTGLGMDRDTQAHIFEPFFTTKDPGKGTGLGLAIVFGIVKQTGGHIWVYSEVGKGTTFKVYLPRTSGAAEVPTADAPAAASERGNETILLV